MTPTRQGSFHLFRFLGIDVYLHWLWFAFAWYSISVRIPSYHSAVWGVLEYLALFLIVLMHEYGHSLACRSVGGKADQIVLWPLGGVAYVDPPPRAGAMLWSIGAGPLVNVVLLPITVGVLYLGYSLGWPATHPDRQTFCRILVYMNGGLLAFNLLPIYPLDGGQILRSLLWFPLGRARSQLVASIIGFVGIIGVMAYLLPNLSSSSTILWYGMLAIFLLTNCWRGFVEARTLRKIELLPRRPDFACPNCHSAPPIGTFWGCQQCGKPFDMFASSAVCPHCGLAHAAITCPDCGSAKPLETWARWTR